MCACHLWSGLTASMSTYGVEYPCVCMPPMEWSNSEYVHLWSGVPSRIQTDLCRKISMILSIYPTCHRSGLLKPGHRSGNQSNTMQTESHQHTTLNQAVVTPGPSPAGERSCCICRHLSKKTCCRNTTKGKKTKARAQHDMKL